MILHIQGRRYANNYLWVQVNQVIHKRSQEYIQDKQCASHIYDAMRHNTYDINGRWSLLIPSFEYSFNHFIWHLWSIQYCSNSMHVQPLSLLGQSSPVCWFLYVSLATFIGWDMQVTLWLMSPACPAVMVIGDGHSWCLVVMSTSGLWLSFWAAIRSHRYHIMHTGMAGRGHLFGYFQVSLVTLKMVIWLYTNTVTSWYKGLGW